MGIFTDRHEIEAIRTSGAILSDALADVVRAVSPGVTTEALDQVAAASIRNRGGSPAFLGYQGYPKTLCVSVNDEVVHGIPQKNHRLHEGDIVGLDLGVIFEGFYTDMAYSMAVGKTDPASRRLLEVTREALRRAVTIVHPGLRTGDLGATVQAYVEAEKFGVVRDLVGHGIGRRLHDDPKVPNFGQPGSGEILRRGQLIAIEPMVTAGDYHVSIDDDGWTVRTRDRSRSAHFEQTVLVTEQGVEVITPYGKNFES